MSGQAAVEDWLTKPFTPEMRAVLLVAQTLAKYAPRRRFRKQPHALEFVPIAREIVATLFLLAEGQRLVAEVMNDPKWEQAAADDWLARAHRSIYDGVDMDEPMADEEAAGHLAEVREPPYIETPEFVVQKAMNEWQPGGPTQAEAIVAALRTEGTIA